MTLSSLKPSFLLTYCQHLSIQQAVHGVYSFLLVTITEFDPLPLMGWWLHLKDTFLLFHLAIHF